MAPGRAEGSLKPPVVSLAQEQRAASVAADAVPVPPP